MASGDYQIIFKELERLGKQQGLTQLVTTEQKEREEINRLQQIVAEVQESTWSFYTST